jgi:hypothetical protein
MRKAVTFLQSVARFRANRLITEDDVHDITGVSHQQRIREHTHENCRWSSSNVDYS